MSPVARESPKAAAPQTQGRELTRSEGGQLARHTGHHSLVIASNRLPVRLTIADGKFDVHRSVGGLSAALGAMRGDATWIGWPGAVVPPALEKRVSLRLAKDSLFPVFLSADEETDFYGRVCNDTLWPLFHYFSERLRITPEAWARYVQVNERYAEVILEHCEPDARVWVHDFHLMLVPAMLRRRAPRLSIGFFLHIPFPSSEVYRLLPAREQVLRGVLGADYVSFQVGDYARHFRSSCLRILGVDSDPDGIELDGRRVGIGVDPIGIDVEGFREVLDDPETAHFLEDLEKQYEGRRLVLGVERLDYTKGIPQKLHAFERFLEQDPARAATTTMIQVLVPSRLESPEYRAQRDEIELLIARINGRFAQPGVTPVEYIHRDISKQGLVALYRRADVMMITALRDGMNLVAQEFVLCQSEPGLPGRWRGSLLLSELAGSAQVLPGALLVNPWDVEGVVGRLATALELPARERQRRLETRAWGATRSGTAAYAARLLSTRSSRRGWAAGSRVLVRGRSCSTTTERCASSRSTRILPSRPRRSARSCARLQRFRRRTFTSSAVGGDGTSSSGSDGFRFTCAPSTGISPGRPAVSGARSSSSTSPGFVLSSGCCGGSQQMSRARTSSGSRAALRGTTARLSASTDPGGRMSS
jgi:trehalose 6-phosphate synthase/phosphatase